jgi:hypothetical protein
MSVAAVAPFYVSLKKETKSKKLDESQIEIKIALEN